MALYHKWDIKYDFAYVLQFFPLISDGLGSVIMHVHIKKRDFKSTNANTHVMSEANKTDKVD